MDMEYIYGMIQKMKINFLEIGMQGSGRMENVKDMGNFTIAMEIYMRDNGKIIKKKDLVFFIIKIELNILEVLKKII